MRNKPWYSILVVGLVFLLASFVTGCGCTSGYTQEDINTAWQEGYTQGFADGIAQCENGTGGENGGEKELPSDAIQWFEAKDHIGDRTTVCGPVIDGHWASGSNGKPTFLNIGKPYPDPDRFTVVIWIDNRANFPQPLEDYYLGKTICVTGLITEYDGIAQIEAQSPTQIEDP